MFEEELVRTGYNKMGYLYNEIRNREKNFPELDYLTTLLPSGGHILDAGCGAGEPVAKYLVEHGFQVTGIDVSPRILGLAKQQVPEGEFLEGDMAQLTFPDESFDGVVSLYALWHISKEKHELVFQNFYRVLKPGGILFFNTGIHAMEGTNNFLGVTMYWSSPAPKTTLALVKAAGLKIIRDEILVRGGETQYWIFARK
ncbi:MAG: class I SAM-dependent methyltransferase [Candidatus Thorarchaeota archaeon]